MDDQRRSAEIEALARTAARLAGRNPDEYVRLELGEVVVFEGPMWRYHDFIVQAERAYAKLAGTDLSGSKLAESAASGVSLFDAVHRSSSLNSIGG